MKNAGDVCPVFLISMLCTRYIAFPLLSFQFSLLSLSLFFCLQIVLSVLWQTGKKFIAGNLQMYPRVGGKGGWPVAAAVFGDRWRGYATEITAATHRFPVTFPLPSPLLFLKNRDGEGEPEREPMNHAWDTNRTKRFASAPVPAPAAAPFPPRPPSIFHSSICWKSGINQSTSQNMFSFASSHPKVKCWYMLRTAKHLLLACLWRTFTWFAVNLKDLVSSLY